METIIHPQHNTLFRKITRRAYIQVQAHQLERNLWEVINIYNDLTAPTQLRNDSRGAIWTGHQDAKRQFQEYYQHINAITSEIFEKLIDTMSEAYLDGTLLQLRNLCQLIKSDLTYYTTTHYPGFEKTEAYHKLNMINRLTFVHF